MSSVVCALTICLIPFLTAAAEQIETITVVATPLGSESAIEGSTPRQVVSGESLREQAALDLTEYMQRNFAGVFVNEAQGNLLQPDVHYRGYVGSPLLGLPQGLAVYQDGVRVNEPFGDTVSWVLIPHNALDSGTLIAGSNALYGLNALGGAISIETRSGRTHPGTQFEALAGSNARRSVQAETGGVTGNGHYFLAGSYLEEDGWRDFSSSRVGRLFARVGSEFASGNWDATLTWADTDLMGNGAAPVQLLQLDRRSIFTHPDRTQNDLLMFNTLASVDLSDSLSLSGNLYVRSSDVRTFNGDDSDFEACDDTPGFICSPDTGTPIQDAAGNPVPTTEPLSGATINRTDTDQLGYGFSGQTQWQGKLGRQAQSLVLGIAYDESDVTFASSTGLGMLDGSRRAIPGGVLVSESLTLLETNTRNSSAFGGYSLTLGNSVSLTLSGRFNHTRVDLTDQLGTALDGSHRFARFNPGAGISWSPLQPMTLWIRYDESNRVPSPMELTCADETAPCRLPNAFLADPPLDDVVARTLEGGLRGRMEEFSWQISVFQMANEDDIQFISAGTLTNQGYFENVGRTRRVGLELLLGGQLKRLNWSASYSWLEATFREDFSVPSVNNPDAVGGEVSVVKGDRLPLLPEHLIKAGLDYPITPRISVGAQLVAGSDFFLRGDEGNDGERYGRHVVVSLRGEFAFNDSLRLFVKVDNVLNEDYWTFGTFGTADEVLGDEFDDSRFFTPAAPRGAWVGIRAGF